MMDDDEAPTIRERYSLAARASRLTVRADRPGNVDLLIAAGWIKDGLATTLYRLMSEFDVVRGEQRVATVEQDRLAREWSEASTAAAVEVRRRPHERSILFVGPPSSQHFMRGPNAISLAATRAATQARAFHLLEMKTLPLAKRAVLRYADQQATFQGLVDLSPDEVAQLCGQVLQTLLDPLCPVCEGRGFTGGFSAPQVWHQGEGSCRRTGRRIIKFSPNPVGELFARWLLADLDRKASRVDRLMRKFMQQYIERSDDHDPARAAAAQEDLRRQLVDLRSAEAASD